VWEQGGGVRWRAASTGIGSDRHERSVLGTHIPLNGSRTRCVVTLSACGVEAQASACRDRLSAAALLCADRCRTQPGAAHVLDAMARATSDSAAGTKQWRRRGCRGKSWVHRATSDPCAAISNSASLHVRALSLPALAFSVHVAHQAASTRAAAALFGRSLLWPRLWTACHRLYSQQCLVQL
jgi:hypothetical protein